MTTVNLTKGGRVDLEKASPGLTQLRVGISWDANSTDSGKEFDIDVSAFGLVKGGDGKMQVVSNDYFLFYGSVNRALDNGTIVQSGTAGKPCMPGLVAVHSGDNKTGSGTGDDETILVDVEKMKAIMEEMSFVVTIHDAVARKQNFGQISNATVKVYDHVTGAVLSIYNLEESSSGETALQVGSLYKNPEGHVAFKAVMQGYRAGLAEFCSGYGVQVG